MKENALIQLALELPKEWSVVSSDLDLASKIINIQLEFKKGSRFNCPKCSRSDCSIHDTKRKSWRHLNFFQHQAFIKCSLPRVECEDCGVLLIDAPWARKESGFTLLFESYMLLLAREMPINAISKLVGEQDTRIWRVIKHYVKEAMSDQDFSKVTQIGVDETSAKKNHKYISVFVDMDNSKVIYATPGKDSSTFNRFAEDLKLHNGNPNSISDVSIDMSPAFVKGVKENLPNAEITFDKFHVMKIINKALGEVRASESKQNDSLKGTRYIWLKNPTNLTAHQKKKLDELLALKSSNMKTVRAYHIKLSFQELFKNPPELADAFFKKWYYWATHSQIKQIVDAATTVKKHWKGILKWFDSRLTNAVLEGTNSFIQMIKSRARGFRNNDNFIAMIYLKLAKIDLELPT